MRTLPEPFRFAWLKQSSLDFIIAEASRMSPCETGGVLLGYWVKNLEEVVITSVLGPGPSAVHKSHRFIPDSEYHLREIARLYEESACLHTYLGDWHTHPSRAHSLSRLDRVTLRRIAKYAPARLPAPIMAVLAGSPAWTVQVWCRFPPRLQSFWRARILPFVVRLTPD
jgi:integrative and conjugative element protein (TIGR02256 family)